MLVWKKILWLRDRIVGQQRWIDRCGGDLAGYIANYGDPGIPPLDANGQPQTFKLTPAQEALFDEGYLTPVPGLPGTFYKQHFGDGGTAIYKADYDRLATWQQELAKLESKHHAALVTANQKQGKVKVRE